MPRSLRQTADTISSGLITRVGSRTPFVAPRSPRDPTIGVTNRLNTALSGFIAQGEECLAALVVGQFEALVVDPIFRQCDCKILHRSIERYLGDEIAITGGHPSDRDMNGPILSLIKGVHIFAFG